MELSERNLNKNNLQKNPGQDFSFIGILSWLHCFKQEKYLGEKIRFITFKITKLVKILKLVTLYQIA